MVIEQKHREHLKLSGLTDERIDSLDWYTEVSPVAIARLLNWSRPNKRVGACLVIRFRDYPSGEPNCYARIRPDKPRSTTKAKYESPVGSVSRAYFTPEAIEAAKRKGAVLAIVEGEKKAESSAMAGVPTIALVGIWNGFKPREKGEDGRGKGPRVLLDELAAIDWQGRTVIIIFDTDPIRNRDVFHARAELARVLTEHGAEVRFVDLPLGPTGEDGLPMKTGADDYIYREGPEAFRQLVHQVIVAQPVIRDLEDFRREMSEQRVAILNADGFYLDRSPTGSGKSHADVEAMRVAGTSLIVVPNHSHCGETAACFSQLDVVAVPYPALSGETCENFREASYALDCGLSVASAVCPGCRFQNDCEYHLELAEAENSPHRIATHKRAELAFENLAANARYCSIHEDSTNILRPLREISSIGPLQDVAAVARDARHALNFKNNGTLAHTFQLVEDAAEMLISYLRDGEAQIIQLPQGVKRPMGIDPEILKAIRYANIRPGPDFRDALQVCLGIAYEEVGEAVLSVHNSIGRGRQPRTTRTVVANWKPRIPKSSVMLNDATATAESIAAATGRPVIDVTPAGDLEEFHPVLQFPLDVTKSTSEKVFLGILRGLMAHLPHYRKIGLICDSKFVPAVRGTSKKVNLEDFLRDRIAKSEYFRSGNARGSNEFLETCDAIFCIGTPRIRTSVIKKRLIQIGKSAASIRDGQWGPAYWSGLTPTGRRQTIRGLGYADWDWNSAHKEIVAAEILQSAGRGRAILENGLPVFLVTNEEIGIQISDLQLQPLTETDVRALKAIASLRTPFPKRPGDVSQGHHFLKNIIGDAVLSTPKPKASEIATQIGISESGVKKIFKKLHDAKLLEHVGKRGGWKPTPNVFKFFADDETAKKIYDAEIEKLVEEI